MKARYLVASLLTAVAMSLGFASGCTTPTTVSPTPTASPTPMPSGMQM